MSNSIEVVNVGKCYKLGEDSVGDLRDRLSNMSLKKVNRRADFWAIRDVSFEVESGTSLGIVGSNGAGKSTLLKLISRVVQPTVGETRTRGHVATLLEAGAGFHPELTGRENIMLSGAIYGLRRSDILKHLDQIVDFAGIEKFLDTPVKRYSSGMFVRLGFAIAAFLENDILVVDEVLSVGDANFRAKAASRVAELACSGRTVLFVSHNLTTIEQLCERVIWLSDGQLKLDGGTKEVLDAYLSSAPSGYGNLLEPIENAPAEIVTIDVVDKQMQSTAVVDQGDPVRVRVDLSISRAEPDTYLVILLIASGNIVVTSSRYPKDHIQSLPVGDLSLIVEFPGILSPGVYSVGVNLRGDLESYLASDYQMNVIEFRVNGHSDGVPNQIIDAGAFWEVAFD